MAFKCKTYLNVNKMSNRPIYFSECTFVIIYFTNNIIKFY